MTTTQTTAGEEKQRQWTKLAADILRLAKAGPRGLRSLSGAVLSDLIDRYQALTADLARARSLGASPSTVDRLNRIAVAGHNLLYGHIGASRKAGTRKDWIGAFARAVRDSIWAVALSAGLLFGSAVASYVAVQAYPELAYDLVPPGFYDFEPTSDEHMHEIPGLARPLVSSSIMTHNIQVTLAAFGLGLTAGIGTAYLLLFNGLTLGAVAGWLSAQGRSRALWGWVMPHGGTEMLAICLAGAAGFLLAGAILAPGRTSRATALRLIAGRALTIELGVMFMLVIAGLIEGFVSPSGIGYPARIVILAVSLAAWAAYFFLAGRSRSASPARTFGESPESASGA